MTILGNYFNVYEYMLIIVNYVRIYTQALNIGPISWIVWLLKPSGVNVQTLGVLGF